jgi:nudix-type nucleoside diphosphatase (YffH/AdpP family)
MASDKIQNLSRELLSDNWYKLEKVTYEIQLKDGSWEKQTREAYDRGNGAAVLLYNWEKRSVILTRQFRLPTYLNGNVDGYLLEVCAGLLDERNPEEAIRKEAEEETGYRLDQVEKVFELYMSPGSVTEIIHFYMATYSDEMRVSKGGGLQKEQEHIEVVEISFDQAFEMMEIGSIRDAKTLILLQLLKLKTFNLL